MKKKLWGKEWGKLKTYAVLPLIPAVPLLPGKPESPLKPWTPGIPAKPPSPFCPEGQIHNVSVYLFFN